MNILFVGDLTPYSRSFQRYKTLECLGHSIVGVSWSLPVSKKSCFFKSLLEKIMWKISLPLDLTSTNKKIIEAISFSNFGIIWIEKGNTIKPKTLRFIKKKIPNVKLVSVSEDDMYASHNHSLYYCKGLKYYDVVFTTKVYNLEELKKLGAKRTELFLDAYDETLHRPVELSESNSVKYGCDVGFVGTFEIERATDMLFLAQNGIKVVVWGNGWESWLGKHKNLIVKNEAVYGEEYVKAINGTKINLCFLRKINRDEVTSRSVEIPACGGFMIAERTKRHEDFFKDKEEAVFFSSKEELLELVKYYLSNNNERKRIANMGNKRCAESGYSQKEQLKIILSKLFSLI